MQGTIINKIFYNIPSESKRALCLCRCVNAEEQNFSFDNVQFMQCITMRKEREKEESKHQKNTNWRTWIIAVAAWQHPNIVAWFHFISPLLFLDFFYSLNFIAAANKSQQSKTNFYRSWEWEKKIENMKLNARENI